MARFHELTGFDRIPPQSTGNDAASQAVIQQAEDLFATKTTDAWLAELTEIGFPCARYNTPHEAVATEQVEANGYVVDLEHPVYGEHRVVGMPFSFSDTPVIVATPAPSLGEHTAEVLGELGYSPDEIAGIVANGSIG